MAWKDTLQDAKYKGVALNVMATDDSAERAQVRHEYPYRDGAEVEDLGRRARQIRLQCVFFGKDYEAELRTLFEALAKSGPGELIHPVFGSITASLLAYHVQHQAENRDHCMVVLDFVEAEPDAPFFGTGASAAAKAQNGASRLAGALDSAQNLHAAATGNWSNRVVGALSYVARGALVSDARAVLQRAADYARLPKRVVLGALARGQSLLATAKGLVASVEEVSRLPSEFGKFSSLANFSDLLPRFGLGDGQAAPYVMTPAAYAGAPVSGPLSGAPEARPLLVLAPQAPASQAVEPDLATPAGQGRAMAAASLNLASAVAVAQAASAALTAQVESPTLTPAEVEAVVGVSRQRLQDSLDEHRAILPTYEAYPITQQLRAAALAVQELGGQVIRLHPPVVELAAPTPCNLHLLAHRLYGDYTRAGELERLNPGLRNPNFVAPGQTLYGYAR